MSLNESLPAAIKIGLFTSVCAGRLASQAATVAAGEKEKCVSKVCKRFANESCLMLVN